MGSSTEESESLVTEKLSNETVSGVDADTRNPH